MHKAINRYARCLFDLSQEEKCTEKIYSDISTLNVLLEESLEFNQFIENPEIPTKKREAIFTHLFGKNFEPLTINFLNFLEHKDRLSLLKHICESFIRIHFKHTDILDIHVTSAQAMAKEQITALKTKLKKKLNKDILCSTHLDPKLIGGFKIQNQDQIYDFSIKTQLEKFKQRIICA